MENGMPLDVCYSFFLFFFGRGVWIISVVNYFFIPDNINIVNHPYAEQLCFTPAEQMRIFSFCFI